MTDPTRAARSAVQRPSAPPRRRRPRTAAALLPAIALAAAAVLLPAGIAHADEPTIGIAGGPAGDAGPDGRSRFTYEASPGQQVTDRYVVRNTGSTEQQVTVFGSDAYNTNDGAFALLETGEQPTDAGSWVSFGGQPTVQLTLAPAAQQLLEFVVAVPPDAAPGDHAAGVVVSSQSVEGQVKVDRRVATRLYVRVAGALTPGLTISSLSATQTADWNPLSGGTDVTVTVQNTGNVALGADLTTRIGSWFGSTVGPTVTEQLPEMLPGTTREVTFHLAGVPRAGFLQPEVLLGPTVPEGAADPGPLHAVSRQTTIAAVPWLALGVVALVVGLALLARWRRSQLIRQAEEWAEYTRAEARREAGTSDASTAVAG